LKRLRTFPAALPFVTLAPGERFIDRNLVIYADGPLVIESGQLWVGYAMGALLEGNVRVWASGDFSEGQDVYLGGVYLHKHERYQTRNDYLPLEGLRDVGPIEVPQGMGIFINRDIANVDWFLGPAVNCWDCELLLTISW
jgi:hypothetical protein